ncbi:uncharacterized protein B0H64DRAFT_169331 [Chaetomium fimeti]|uniref:Uncharacterized protein n=1 Tax=Chaetomium fimeti TaxID=1854472 RepID=A0AAE0HHM5_9PEZI|nr:hypothetical protein B0H64DRAFT_169331 [Chaetomium fimeti]
MTKADESMATRYREAMRRHRFGYALYEPAPFSRLRPGMLGFLDEYQRWHPILDLTDAAAVKAAGFEPLGPLQRAEPDVRKFGPLTASGVAETSIDLEAGVGAAALGLPLDVGGVLQYSTAGDFGAVLMCDADVVTEGFDFRDPFAVWIRHHAAQLFKRYPEVCEHGVCAATWTYASTDIHINAWQSADNRVVIGCDLAVAGVAKAGPKVSWHRGSAGSGWSAWTDQKRVIFFTGVKIRKGFCGSREEPEKRWRGGEEVFEADDDETGESYPVGLEMVGDDWYAIDEPE